jgi:hypothetical protein
MKEHVLSLPNKLQEEVAEGGDNFSAGQRQVRLCVGGFILFSGVLVSFGCLLVEFGPTAKCPTMGVSAMFIASLHSCVGLMQPSSACSLHETVTFYGALVIVFVTLSLLSNS